MKLSTNIMRLINHYDIYQIFDLLSKVGFESIDFNSDLPYYVEKGVDKDYFLDLKKYANDKGLEIGQTHALFCRPGWDPNEHDKRTKIICESIKVAGYLGAYCTVVHPIRPGEFPNSDKLDLYEETIKYYQSFIPYYEETGVKIAIENVRNSVTFLPDGLLKLYKELNNPAFTICFDVGHCLLAGVDPAEEIKKFKDLIGCTHIHDNNGEADSHTLPFYGNIDWDSVCKAFAEIDYNKNFNYEASGFVAKLPKEFYETSYKYMADVGHYLINKINFYKTNK